MKYLCLIYDDVAQIASLSDEQSNALRSEVTAYLQELEESGHLIDCHPLESASRTTSVRVRQGRVQTTDGPFAETKEQIGGYFVIEARDLNEAISIVGRWPSASMGAVEIRRALNLEDIDVCDSVAEFRRMESNRNKSASQSQANP